MLPVLLLMLALPLAGPANCNYVVPADLHAGTPEWLGPCAAGHAEGTGVLRVVQADGKAELFYGRYHQGFPQQGMFGNSDGAMLNPTHSFSPRTGHSVDDNATADPAGQDARLWTLAAAAANVAAQHYAALGNQASAAFYRKQAKQLGKGPGE